MAIGGDMTVQTDHLVDLATPVVDADGRAVVLAGTYAWRSSHSSRTGRVVALVHRGVPCAELIAWDSGASVVVKCSALVRVAEEG